MLFLAYLIIQLYNKMGCLGQ